MKPYVIKVEICRPPDRDDYPFSIASIRNTAEFNLHEQVTFLIGDNGSGKSTLLEAIALRLGLNQEGGNRNTKFKTIDDVSQLATWLRIVKSTRRYEDAFFFRAETMYNLYSAAIKDNEENPGLGWIIHGWKELHNRSHGEGHIDVIARKMSNGLYIFDEPESALSVEKQLEFLVTLHDLIGNGSQVIIATHSPIILSYPHSIIYDLTAEGVMPIQYEAAKPFRMMKSFINNHSRYISELLK